MLPLALVRDLPVVLVGGGEAGRKRLSFLTESKLSALIVFWPDGEPPSADVLRRAPSEDEIAAARVLFVAGRPRAEGERLAAAARAARVLVNVEDENDLCDLHVPSAMRRGDLTVAVSTAGKAPYLAARLRREVERALPAVWGERIARADALRLTVRGAGGDGAAVKAAIDDLAAREGWFGTADAP